MLVKNKWKKVHPASETVDAVTILALFKVQKRNWLKTTYETQFQSWWLQIWSFHASLLALKTNKNVEAVEAIEAIETVWLWLFST